MTLVAALSLTTASAHALAREFRNQADDSGVRIDSDRTPLGAAMASVQADAERDPTAAALVERKVE